MSAGERFHLAERRQPAQRLHLDLTHSLARQAEAAPDLLERLRLGVREAVAEDDDLPLALRERCERLQKMNRAERTLWMELGREPTLEEIAEEANLPLHQAREVRAAARASTSLDQPVGEEEDAVFGDFLAGEGPLPEEEVETALRSQALAAALGVLSERDRSVLVLRYGLDDAEPKTLEEIGRRLGLTRERVRQIELDSLRRLAKLREMEGVEQ